jgi:protein phosphatase
MNFTIQSLCHQGAVRSNNEDAISYGIEQKYGIAWMLIADGMGGHNAGEVASAMLVEHVKIQWDKLSLNHPPNWLAWITDQLNSANLAILSQAKKSVAQQGMGTTGVLMVLEANNCHLGWIGDSRAYTLKNNQLSQETTDHTMLQELVNKGAISAETAKQSNTKNLLSQAIGVQENISVGTVTVELNSGDSIMLSTDGLHDYLSDDDINYFLLRFTENQDTCHEMINLAIAQKSRDNLTVGLVRLTDNN